jgi:nitrite reductase/ring-hydroxylating ferredoxin subunit
VKRVVDRREFVAACAGLGACVILGGCVGLVTHPVPVHAGRVRLALGSFPELTRENGAIKVLPDAFGEPLYVLSAGDGYVAVSPVCPHRGCTVDIHGPRLVCPCHGSTFDRSGMVLRGPAERPLERFSVLRDGDYLIIDLGAQA